MKQFIKDNRPYAQTSREDFAQKYLEEGCEEVPVLYIQGTFIDAIWNGIDFVEGATSEEITEEQNKILQNKISEYRAKIYESTEKLLDSSKARALGKVGQGLTRNQLEVLEIFYIKKNNVAISYIADETILDASIFELIQFEEENDFEGTKLTNKINFLNTYYEAQIPTDVSRIKQYCYLISVKFVLGKAIDEMLKSLCEIFRSKLITNLDRAEFDKIDQRIELIKSITNQTSIPEIMALKTPFDAI